MNENGLTNYVVANKNFMENHLYGAIIPVATNSICDEMLVE